MSYLQVQRDFFNGYQGGDTVPQVGIPGGVAIFTENGFPILLNGSKTDPVAIAAAGYYGAGRVVAIAHDGYFSDAKASAFINHCKGWASNNGAAQVVVGGEDSVAKNNLKQHVWGGGGAIVGVCPWGWLQINRGKTLADLQLNGFLAECGLAFLEGYNNAQGNGGGYSINPSAQELLDASAFHGLNIIRGNSSNPQQQQQQQQHGGFKPQGGGLLHASPNAAAGGGPLVQATQIPRDPNLLIEASPGSLSDARVVYQNGNWWAVCSDHLTAIFRFPQPIQICRADTECSNVDACPKQIIISASNDGRQWCQLGAFPFKSNTREGGGNERQAFNIPPQNQQCAVFYKVEWVGIHNSHYIGVNDLWFYKEEQSQGACKALASCLAAIPVAQKSAIASTCTQSCHEVLCKEPSEQSPLQVDPKVKLMCALANNNLLQAPLPGEASFPGRATGQPIAATEVHIPATKDRQWLSTFKYCNPLEQMQLEIKQPMPPDMHKWKLRIGCHCDDLMDKEEWKRWPQLTTTYTIQQAPLHLVHRFGGIIFFESMEENAPAFSCMLRNVHACPYASAETGYQLVDGDAPWGELHGEKISICLPRDIMVGAKDRVPEIIKYWDGVLTSHHELALPPYKSRRERLVPDRQISAGYMHAGHPIMTHMDFAPRVVDLNLLRTKGEWGAFHELGHNMQQGWWTWTETVEVTVNLFTLYTMVHFVGLRDLKAMDFYKQGVDIYKDYNAKGRQYERWAKEPSLALLTYAELIEQFGWQAFKDVFKWYEREPPQNLKNDQDKRDEWVYRFSTQVQRNTFSFFTDARWGLPISASVKDRLRQFPEWRGP